MSTLQVNWETESYFPLLPCTLHDLLKPQSDNRHLNHFAFLMQCDFSHSNTKKLIYFGGDKYTPPTSNSSMNYIETKQNDAASMYLIHKAVESKRKKLTLTLPVMI